MSYLDAIILGVIQGLTEFLPISSSGHLVLTEAALGVKQPGVSFEVILHLGTLFSVLVYFRSRIIALVRSVFTKDMRQERAIVGYLILGTIPAGIVGLLFKDFFERAFSDPRLTSIMLLVTGVILLLPRFVKKRNDNLSIRSALLMGLGQAAAIFPGISRSGSTIAIGMMSRVEPGLAAEFSFLLSIPAIGGAAILSLSDLSLADSGVIGQYLLGALFAFIFGIAAVYLVLSAVRKGKFEYFAFYCFAAGLFGLYLFF